MIRIRAWGLELYLLALTIVTGELELPLLLTRMVIAANSTERDCKNTPQAPWLFQI